ncbi:MAG: hypothetical protein KDB69_02425 [Acidimicrobiia bacterium]|nr:hypothetical protein [Acidimicrobiia bacterium]
MDTTRWETEAIRVNRSRPAPPRPTAKQSDPGSGTRWVTLKEAESATGIPTNTLRKWVRKDTIATYLESDGDVTLRMVDLDDIRQRAADLGRTVTPSEVREPRPEIRDPTPRHPDARSTHEAARADEPGPETLVVPIDAWNKMLAQLGNLHEAGQQLAEARERAAKAETEASFLRDRLRELREATIGDVPSSPTSDEDDPLSDPGPVSADELRDLAAASRDERPTTTYWRYLTTGWRDRRRRDGR